MSTLINKSEKKLWKIPSSGASVTISDIVKKIKSNPNYMVHIGTDSHRNKGSKDHSHIFATVICLYEPGKGATYYYKRIIDKTKYESINQRMIAEASLSINTSLSIMDHISLSRIVVHSDTNSDARFPTYKSTQIIRSWVKSLGCKFRCKPEAWASSSVADWHSK